MNKLNLTLPAESFYDDVSDIYEKMIDFEKNLSLRNNAYKNIFPEKGSVLDVGCGIGLDSIALAMNGHDVTSFDVSPKMIEAAKFNALKYKVKINARVLSFSSINKEEKRKFNNVISVGNTVAHLNPSELNSAVKKIYVLLVPKGKVFLHILNYRKIIKEEK